MIRHILKGMLNSLLNHSKEKETPAQMNTIEYSIHLSESNAIERIKTFNNRAFKAKTQKTMFKNVRNSDALYAEYRELIEQEPNYVTLCLDDLGGIFDD